MDAEVPLIDQTGCAATALPPDLLGILEVTAGRHGDASKK
jgi:hypothetical protein